MNEEGSVHGAREKVSREDLGIAATAAVAAALAAVAAGLIAAGHEQQTEEETLAVPLG